MVSVKNAVMVTQNRTFLDLIFSKQVPNEKIFVKQANS